jgi:acetyl-CoA C-acetyltransferase
MTNNHNDPVVIVGMARTPMGAFQGELTGFTASDLGKAAIEESLKRSGLQVADIEDVIMGCVLPAGQRRGFPIPSAPRRSTRCAAPA